MEAGMSEEEFDEEEYWREELEDEWDRRAVLDPSWEPIQKKTFTKWVNQLLKTVDKQINDLGEDFTDGLRLIALVEVLAGTKFENVNKRPNFRAQKLENVTKVLEFLDKDGVRIVNIGSADIVDRNLKLTLALVWTLILHYYLEMPACEEGSTGPVPESGRTGPVTRLLRWVQEQVPDLSIRNFTNDFNDGRAIGALVNSLSPGLCSDWEEWKRNDSTKNTARALDAAEKHLKIAQLILPEDMTSFSVDKLSMVTYLSQFYKAFGTPATTPVTEQMDLADVKVYGAGIEATGNRVRHIARFTVDTSGPLDKLDVTVLDPQGKVIKCDSIYVEDEKGYLCEYQPETEGEFQVFVKAGDRNLCGSPYTVLVDGESKVTVEGPGIDPSGVVAGLSTSFRMYTKEIGVVDSTGCVIIEDPTGDRDAVIPSIVSGKDDGFFQIEYTPTVEGIHRVHVRYAIHSPFEVNVSRGTNSSAAVQADTSMPIETGEQPGPDDKDPDTGRKLIDEEQNDRTSSPESTRTPVPEVDNAIHEDTEIENIADHIVNFEDVADLRIYKDKLLSKIGTPVYEGVFEGCIPVAIKQIHRVGPESEKELRDHLKLLRGVENIRKMPEYNHQNIIRFFKSETTKDFVYIATELCHGTLEDYVRQPEQWTELPWKAVLRQMTIGLSFLHDTVELVHRDLKPSNVLLFRSPLVTKVVLADFGQSKQMTEMQCSMSTVPGTLGWIAPEIHAKSPRFYPESDIFSLGCLFFYVITGGKHPFGEAFIERLTRIASNSCDLSSIPVYLQCLKELVADMIHCNHSDRPSARTVSGHPSLLDDVTIIDFLHKASNRINSYPATQQNLLENTTVIPGGDWIALLPVHTKLYLSTFKLPRHPRPMFQGKEGSVRHLLRAIRNCSEHFPDLDAAVRVEMGATTPDHVKFWFTHFPWLLTHVHSKMKGDQDLMDSIKPSGAT